MLNTDTIAALVSGPVYSGVGVIRISGPDALPIGCSLLRVKGRQPATMEPRRVYYGFVSDHDEPLDEVLAFYMKAPHSFTAEDVVEIQCHGGPFIIGKILSAIYRMGARPAEPGEFSKRAFLGGRIDLSQAEAIMDLIHSKNDFSMKNSLRGVTGVQSGRIRSIREKLLHETAYIEAALDDPEHMSLDGYSEQLSKRVKEAEQEIGRLIESFESGKLLAEGISAAIVGKPNVGKSSILNMLLGENRAIVTDIAGTTRDSLEETVKLSGLLLRLIDTAGIRSTEDYIESLGVEKSKEHMERADLILFVLDSSRPFDDGDKNILSLIKDKPCLILLNKTDLPPNSSFGERLNIPGIPVIEFSAKTGVGLTELEKEITRLFDFGSIQNSEAVITNTRHRQLLEQALASLREVEKSIALQLPEDFFTIDLMDAYRLLGLILGEELEEDLVNEIFAKFCMGK